MSSAEVVGPALQVVALENRGADAGALAPAPPLPCLNRDSSTENGILSGSQWKTAWALSENVRAFVGHYGLEHVGFHTETFADHVTDMKEASRRFNSLRTHVLSERYLDYIAVVERQESGRIHFHLLVACREDIRTGFDFVAYDNARRAGNPETRSYWTRIYATSATAALREEWKFWREAAHRYGFGRCELTPIRSNAEAVGRYVGKYIAKHLQKRKPEDKGARLVRYSKGARRWSCRFASLGPGATVWRRKLATFCRISGLSWNQLAEIFGPRWAWHLAPILDCILLEVEEYGNGERANELLARDLGHWGSPEARLLSWRVAVQAASGMSWRFRAWMENYRDAVWHWKSWRFTKSLGNSC
jgi:hypothetical protein